MLGKSYCWVTDDEQKQIVAIFTVSNDSIKTKDLLSSSKNKLQRHINNLKRGRSYPAVLIGRFAVNKLFQGNGYKIGSQTMNSSFIQDGRGRKSFLSYLDRRTTPHPFAIF